VQIIRAFHKGYVCYSGCLNFSSLKQSALLPVDWIYVLL